MWANIEGRLVNLDNLLVVKPSCGYRLQLIGDTYVEEFYFGCRSRVEGVMATIEDGIINGAKLVEINFDQD